MGCVHNKLLPTGNFRLAADLVWLGASAWYLIQSSADVCGWLRAGCYGRVGGRGRPGSLQLALVLSPGSEASIHVGETQREWVRTVVEQQMKAVAVPEPCFGGAL